MRILMMIPSLEYGMATERPAWRHLQPFFVLAQPTTSLIFLVLVLESSKNKLCFRRRNYAFDHWRRMICILLPSPRLVDSAVAAVDCHSCHGKGWISDVRLSKLVDDFLKIFRKIQDSLKVKAGSRGVTSKKRGCVFSE